MKSLPDSDCDFGSPPHEQLELTRGTASFAAEFAFATETSVVFICRSLDDVVAEAACR
ncbi:hypothetical protein D3C83_315020 [compost metagenome]